MNQLAGLLAQGEKLYHQGKFQPALEAFQSVLEEDKDSTQALFYMANIFHLQGQMGKAIKAFQKVLEQDPYHTEASISLSVILNDIGQYEEASQLFNEADNRIRSGEAVVNDPQLNRTFSLKHFELAEQYFSFGRYDEAVGEYRKAIQLDPVNLEARLKLAKSYGRKGFLQEGVDELRKLKEEEPQFMPARVALGLMYYSQGSVIEAQNEWEKVLEKDPSYKDAFTYLKLSRSADQTNLNLI